MLVMIINILNNEINVTLAIHIKSSYDDWWKYDGFGHDVTSIGLGYQPIFKLLLSPLRTPRTHTLWFTPRIYIKHFQLPPVIILVISTLLHHICKWSTEVQTERWECGVRGWRGIEVGGDSNYGYNVKLTGQVCEHQKSITINIDHSFSSIHLPKLVSTDPMIQIQL